MHCSKLCAVLQACGVECSVVGQSVFITFHREIDPERTDYAFDTGNLKHLFFLMRAYEVNNFRYPATNFEFIAQILEQVSNLYDDFNSMYVVVEPMTKLHVGQHLFRRGDRYFPEFFVPTKFGIMKRINRDILWRTLSHTITDESKIVKLLNTYQGR